MHRWWRSAAVRRILPLGIPCLSCTAMATASLTELADIEYRFAMTPDDKLEEVVARLLPALLPQLSSGDGATRAQLMKILSHASTRLKALHTIALPMLQLVHLLRGYSEAQHSLSIRLTSIYLQLGFTRMPTDAVRDLFPTLLRVATFPPAARHVVLALLMRALPHITLHAVDASPAYAVVPDAAAGEEEGDPTDARITRPAPACTDAFPDFFSDAASYDLLCTHFRDVLMLQRGAGGGKKGDAWAPPAGLTLAATAHVLGLEASSRPDAVAAALDAMTTDALAAQKSRVLTCIASGMLAPVDALTLCVVASVDSHHHVRATGDDEYRRILALVRDHAPAVVRVTALVAAGRPAPAADIRVRALEALMRMNTYPQLQAVVGVFFAQACSDVATHRTRVLAVQLLAKTLAGAHSHTMVHTLAPLMKAGLLKLLRDTDTHDSAGQLMTAVYSALTALCGASPEVFRADIDSTALLFARLGVETADARLACVEMLSSLASAYSHADAAVSAHDHLYDLLSTHIEAAEPRVRQCVAHWMITCFPFAHAGARWACMRMCADTHTEIRALARGGLEPPRPRGCGRRVLEDEDATRLTAAEAAARVHASVYPSLDAMFAALRAHDARHALVEAHALTSACALEFLHATACAAAARSGCAGGVSEYYASAPTHARIHMNLCIDVLRGGCDGEGAGILLEVACECLHAVVACAPRIVTHAALDVVTGAPWFRAWAVHASSHVRMHMCDAYAHWVTAHVEVSVSMSPALDALQHALALVATAADARTIAAHNAWHGALYTLGYISARTAASPAAAELCCGPAWTSCMQAVVDTVIRAIGSTHTGISTAATRALCVMTRVTALPLPRTSDSMYTRILDAVTLVDAHTHVNALMSDADVMSALAGTREGVILRLLHTAVAAVTTSEEDAAPTSSATQRLTDIETAAVCMCAMAVAEARAFAAVDVPPSPSRTEDAHEAMSRLRNTAHACGSVAALALVCVCALSVNVHERVHIAIAHALVEALTGSFTPLVWPHMGVIHEHTTIYEEAVVDSGHGMPLPVRNVVAGALVDVILTRICVSTRPHERACGCVWLHTLTRACISSCDSVRERLMAIQDAFLALLREKNSFTQEVAGHGLAHLYDSADEAARTQMLTRIMRAFDTGRTSTLAAASTLTSDPAYANMITLARDAGQPDLLYSFLAVNTHNSQWNTRGGASLGLSALMRTRARAHIEKSFTHIIPRLYVYTHDPSPAVRAHFSRMWDTLVRDDASILKTYFPDIVRECIRACAPERDAREREGGCVSLTQVMHGRSCEEMTPFLQDVWRVTLRAIDDVKDSVRDAGMEALKSVGALTRRFMDARTHSSAEGARVASIIIPYLVRDGLEHPIKDAQTYCLTYLRDVAHVAGRFLRPFLADILSTALGHMSANEDSRMAYIQTHAQAGTRLLGGDIDPVKVEVMRVHAACEGPLYEMVEACVKQIRSMPLIELVPDSVPAGAAPTESITSASAAATVVSVMQRVCETVASLIRGGVGLPTRAVACRTCVKLCTDRPDAVKPYAHTLMRALQACLEDSSPTLRRECAHAAASLASVCKSGTLDKYIARVLELAVVEDAGVRAACAECVRQLFKHAAERMKSHMATLVPLCFAGQYDVDTGTSTAWVDTWAMLAPSPPACVRLYMAEITQRVQLLLDTSAWVQKRQGAAALCAIVALLCDADNSVNVPDVPDTELLIPALDITPDVLMRAVNQHAARAAARECMELLPHADSLIAALVGSVGGRVWEGKHSLLTALGDVLCRCPSALVERGSVCVLSPESTSATARVHRMLSSLLSCAVKNRFGAGEGGDQALEYATCAWLALAAVLAASPCVDATALVIPAVIRALESSALSIVARAAAADEGPAASVHGGVRNEAAETAERTAGKDKAEQVACLNAAACMAAACAVRDGVRLQMSRNASGTADDDDDRAPLLVTSSSALQFVWTPEQAAAHAGHASTVVQLTSACIKATTSWQARAHMYDAVAVLCGVVGGMLGRGTVFGASFDAVLSLIAAAAAGEDKPVPRVSALRCLLVLAQRVRVVHDACRSSTSPCSTGRQLDAVRSLHASLAALSRSQAWPPRALDVLARVLRLVGPETAA